MEDEAKCQICLHYNNANLTADYFCAECRKHMCTGCYDTHAGLTSFQAHYVQRSVLGLADAITCRLHSEEIAHCWCKLCNVTACIACSIKEHQRHDIVDIKSRYEDLLIVQMAKVLGYRMIWKQKSNDLSRDLKEVKFISDKRLCVLQARSLAIYNWQRDTKTFVYLQHSLFQEHNLQRVAASRDNHTLYLTCDRHSCCTVHQYSLHKTRLLQQSPKWPKNMFKSPSGIAVNKAGNLIISDLGLNPPDICVYRPDGSCMFAIGGPRPPFLSPSSFTCGKDSLVISDYEGCCLHVFCGDRLELSVTIKVDGHPHGVSLDDSEHILVITEGNKVTISEYNLSGLLLKEKQAPVSLTQFDYLSASFVRTSDTKLLAIGCSDHVNVFEIK